MPEQAPLILALDISKTCTGVAEGRVGETPRFYSVRCGGIDDGPAMLRLYTWLVDRTEVDFPDWIYFEAPVNPGAFLGEYDEVKGKVRAKSNPNTTIALAKMIGVVELFATGMAIRCRSGMVQTIRKSFLGNGRPENPKQRAKALCELLGWQPNNHDEADAGALWHWAGTQVAPRLYQPITPMMQQKAATLGTNRERI